MTVVVKRRAANSGIGKSWFSVNIKIKIVKKYVATIQKNIEIEEIDRIATYFKGKLNTGTSSTF